MSNYSSLWISVVEEDLWFVSNINGLQVCWVEKLEFMSIDVLKSYKGVYVTYVNLTCPKYEFKD